MITVEVLTMTRHNRQSCDCDNCGEINGLAQRLKAALDRLVKWKRYGLPLRTDIALRVDLKIIQIGQRLNALGVRTGY